ncbi:MAG: TRAP transporter fused permease subunit, partial [Spirochaetales bacterium]|nr:TRAP transporter fused permease subunit [Spirochaetales bacterium]
MYTSIEGVFGIAIGVSATYVYMFILFGAFLSKSGTTQVFADLALAAVGTSVGGPAKVGVIASGLMGTIQGSSAANVAATGLFTIPLMKSLGFKAHFAAAVEAVASCGGQFLPPVMGASAFIMAQYLGQPYAIIAAGALLPALLYYGAVYLQVHLHAKKNNMKGIDRSRLPALRGVLMRKGHLLLPIVVLVGMIVFGFTALFAACIATISIFVISSLRKETRMSFADIVDGLRMAARGGITTALACAIVGLVIGAVALSGLGMLITQQIVRLGAGLLLPTLLLAALSSLVLSFGLPTTSVYIITATLVAPGLTAVGLPPLVSHLFCYYWGGRFRNHPAGCSRCLCRIGNRRFPADEDWIHGDATRRCRVHRAILLCLLAHAHYAGRRVPAGRPCRSGRAHNGDLSGGPRRALLLPHSAVVQVRAAVRLRATPDCSVPVVTAGRRSRGALRPAERVRSPSCGKTSGARTAIARMAAPPRQGAAGG